MGDSNEIRVASPPQVPAISPPPADGRAGGQGKEGVSGRWPSASGRREALEAQAFSQVLDGVENGGGVRIEV